MTFPTLCTSSSGKMSGISWFSAFHPRMFPIPSLPIHAPLQHPVPSKEAFISLCFTPAQRCLWVPPLWQNTKSKCSAQNIAAPTPLPTANIQVCVTSGATHRLSKIHPQILRLVPGRIPRLPSLHLGPGLL